MTSARSGPFRSGSGRMCLDFVRTLRHRGGAAETEELPDRRALDAWIDQFGPWERAPRRAAPGQDALARDLREAVHRMIVAARGPDGVAA
ncbi:ABATE domain-containing protein, partial [Actinomadura roseirufa]|uniref:ABATE domain-containing protein n=1 Tax=Actinomadura roseirufa TaxID=2094049 RepID=UPI001A955513